MSKQALRITASNKKGSFHRCGRHFTTEPTLIAAEELTEAEIKRLGLEPNLNVTVIDVEEPKAKPVAPKKPAAKKPAAKKAPAKAAAKKSDAKSKPGAGE